MATELIKADSLTYTHKKYDLLLTDPPYSLAIDNACYSRHNNGAACKEFDYNFNEQKLIDIVPDLLYENGTALIFCARTQLSKYIDGLSKYLYFKNLLVWHKTNPAPFGRESKYVNSDEYILYFTKNSKKWTFNLEHYPFKTTYYFTPILQGSERFNHPCQKPEKLIKYLLKTHTHQNDTVVDLFAGTGTVAKCCQDLGISSTSFEINEYYYNICKKRLDID